MINSFENQDYGELINPLREIAKQMNHNQEDITQLTKLIDHIDQSLVHFSRLKRAIDQSIIVAVTSVDGKILYANQKFCEISKYSSHELVGKTHRIINSGYHNKRFFKDMWDTINNGDIWEGNIKNRAKDGTLYWVKTSIVPFCDKDNKPYMFIALRTDITKGKESEEKLINALKNDFNMVVSTMNNYVFYVTKDHSGKFSYLFGEGKLAHQLGLDTSYIYKKNPRDIFISEVVNIVEDNYEKAYTGQTVTYNYSYNGHHVVTTLSPIYENGKIIKLIGCSNDISELNRAKEEVEFLAYHDTLTNLPNRRKFTEDITKLMDSGNRFAFFILDLDRFKFINDTLGHTFGDELLKVVAHRLQEALGSDGYLYRFAGDEFIIILPYLSEKKPLEGYADKILAVFKEKFHLNQRIELYSTGSIGISVFPEHGEDIDLLIKNADSAMYVAKRLGKNTYKIYDQTMRQVNQKNLQMETFLRTAIKNAEFQLFYQPKLDIKNKNIGSMEALLRWNHPVLGNIPPNTFIPLAEETGIIWEIDQWVLQQACLQNKRWNDENQNEPLRIAVNISALQFSHPNFVGIVERTLRDTGLEPELLELEITETAIIENTEECLNNVKKLRSMGVMVSIDDFGTGYTSLNYLKRFSFDYIKIDQSYVRDMFKNKEDMAIVKMIISLAHELKLKVIAEGVEEKDIFECLEGFGCDEIQGYLISRPLPQPEFEKMIRDAKVLLHKG